MHAEEELQELERKAEELRRQIYAGLTPYQRVHIVGTNGRIDVSKRSVPPTV
jgi:acetyl-CoA carboxylase alpha subunit